MISVVVPVYRVEKYLDKCVQSILSQSYRDFELILVNDGSPDRCPQICDAYAQQYENIKVLHKKNGGLSDARNAGTAIAKGEFITYIDSDDYISENYLMTLVYLQKDNNADIVVTGIEIFDEGKEPKGENGGTVFFYTGKEALEKMLYQDTIDTSACAMLLPVATARKYPFPIGKYHEDDFTTYKYYSDAKKVVVTTQKQYYYLQRKNSIMHIFGQSVLDELEAADNLVDFCRHRYPDIVSAAESKRFSDYCQVLLLNTRLKEEYPEVYLRINDYLKAVRFQILFDRKCRAKNRIAAMLLLFGDVPLRIANRIRK